jgi:hypothetical protein
MKLKDIDALIERRNAYLESCKKCGCLEISRQDIHIKSVSELTKITGTDPVRSIQKALWFKIKYETIYKDEIFFSQHEAKEGL